MNSTVLASPAKARNDEKLEVGKTSGQTNYKRGANLNEMMKDGQLHNCASSGANSSVTEHASESSSLYPPQAKSSKKKVVPDGHSTKTKCMSILTGQGMQDEQSTESGIAKHESDNIQVQRLSKSKKKKDLSLPRRASKRLAGLEVDTVPELKASTRTRRAGNKLSDNSAGVKQENASGVEEEHDKAEEKPGVSSDSLLADFFTDPCIAFAIKTLKDHSGDIQTDNTSFEKQECSVLPPPGNSDEQEKHEGIVGTGEKSGSSISEPSFGISWTDPCIEFAIKTLTGAIPLEYDPHIEEYFQQQLSSSQGHKDNLLQKEIS